MYARVLIPVLSLVLAVSACGRLTGAGDGAIEHPTDPGALVLRVETGGGFVPPEFSFREIPGFSLYGDGRLIQPGAMIEIYPGPALPGLFVTHLSEEGVQAILEAARDAGLGGPDRSYDWPVVADAPSTTFTLYVEGAKHVISAYALGFETDGQLPPGVSEEEAAARRDLQAFVERLGDLGSLLPEGAAGEEVPYEPSAVRVLVRPYAGTPDPGLVQPEQAWPLDEPLATFGEAADVVPDARCGVVSGEDLDALMPSAQRANELTPWTSGGERFLLLFRPLLPDESGC